VGNGHYEVSIIKARRLSRLVELPELPKYTRDCELQGGNSVSPKESNNSIDSIREYVEVVKEFVNQPAPVSVIKQSKVVIPEYI
jgi:hypothetical protein